MKHCRKLSRNVLCRAFVEESTVTARARARMCVAATCLVSPRVFGVVRRNVRASIPHASGDKQLVPAISTKRRYLPADRAKDNRSSIRGSATFDDRRYGASPCSFPFFFGENSPRYARDDARLLLLSHLLARSNRTKLAAIIGASLR